MGLKLLEAPGELEHTRSLNDYCISGQFDNKALSVF